MSSLTIRKLDDETKARLRLRAARHGRSMEEEARTILRDGVRSAGNAGGDLAAAIRRRFAAVGGVELELPKREPIREPPRPRR
jgi:plasmid stability protein